MAPLNPINRNFIRLFLLWTIIVAASLYHTYYFQKRDTDRIALERAKTSINKDLAYHTWVSSHGGVYVPISEQTPPNPYLAHLPKRDVNTDKGQQLTLINPAYTLRQLMANYSDIYGFEGKITSLKTLNPVNTPDAWESKALLKTEKTQKPYYEFMEWRGKPTLRYMSPMITDESCLKCHAHQGYQVGDIRGGVSVTIPVEDLQTELRSYFVKVILIFLALWLVGSLIIYISYRNILQTCLRLQSEDQ